VSRGVLGDIGVKVPLHVTFYCGGERHKLLNCRVIRLHYILRALGVLVEYFMRTAWWELFVLIRNERPHNAGSRLHFTSVHIASSSSKSSTLSCVWHIRYCVCIMLLLFCILYRLHVPCQLYCRTGRLREIQAELFYILRPAAKQFFLILLWRGRHYFFPETMVTRYQTGWW